MNNLNKLDNELSNNEEIEMVESVNQNEDNEKQINNTDHEPDAVSVLKMDPAIIEARVVNICSYADPLPNQSEEQVPEAMVKTRGREERLGFAECLATLQQSARLSITPQQCALLILYANHLKRQPPRNSPGDCVFCKNNGESTAWYRSHTIKDRRGRVVCPILRAFCCPICGASGTRAHTPKHCPVNKYGYSA